MEEKKKYGVMGALELEQLISCCYANEADEEESKQVG